MTWGVCGVGETEWGGKDTVMGPAGSQFLPFPPLPSPTSPLSLPSSLCATTETDLHSLPHFFPPSLPLYLPPFFPLTPPFLPSLPLSLPPVFPLSLPLFLPPVVPSLLPSLTPPSLPLSHTFPPRASRSPASRSPVHGITLTSA